MQDTPVSGVPGDSRDGVGDTPPRVVVSVADKLRALADWLDAHPGVDIHQIDPYLDPIRVYCFGAHDAAAVAQMARAAGGRWEKVVSPNSDLFSLAQEIMPGFRFEIAAMRDRVCERVVTGTREVEVPDPDAPTVTQTEEIVEWRCGPLLAAETSSAPASLPDDLPF